MNRTWTARGVEGLALLLSLVSCNVVPFGRYADDVWWVSLGEGLLKGSLSRPWSVDPVLETSLNWGYSFLLAPVLAVFGRNVLMLKIASALFLFLGALVFCRSMKSLLAPLSRSLLLLGIVANGFWLSFSGAILSEAGFLLLFGIFLHLLFVQREWGEDSLLRWAGIGALAGALILVRTVGVVAFAAAAAGLVFEKRWKSLAALSVGTAALAIPVFTANFLSVGTPSFYTSYWALRSSWGGPAVAGGMIENGWYYAKALAGLTSIYLPVLGSPPVWARAAWTLALSVPALWGAWNVRRDPLGRFLLLFGTGYFFILCAWSYRAPRYALLILPVAAAWFLIGLQRAAERRAWPLVLCGVLVLGTNAGEITRSIRASLTSSVELPHESIRWLDRAMAPGERVVSSDILRIHYYTGRKGDNFLPGPSAREFAANARRRQVSWFLLSPGGFVETSPGVEDPIADQHARLEAFLSDPSEFAPVYENPEEGVRVYRLREVLP